MRLDRRPCPPLPVTDSPSGSCRWQLAWAHREELLAIARRRTRCPADAEDVVQEAMLRAAEHQGLDEERIAPWLTRVVVNLCADVHREARFAPHRTAYAVRHGLADASPEEVVVARVTAAHACARLAALPERQRHALLMKADGLSVHDVACRMDVGYKTVESLLSRGRLALRGRLGALVPVALHRRAGTAGRATGLAATSALVAVATAALVLPTAAPAGAGAPRGERQASRAAVPPQPARPADATTGPLRATPATPAVAAPAARPPTAAYGPSRAPLVPGRLGARLGRAVRHVPARLPARDRTVSRRPATRSALHRSMPHPLPPGGVVPREASTTRGHRAWR